MSVILFLIVFNILLELLAVLCSQVGYEPSFSDDWKYRSRHNWPRYGTRYEDTPERKLLTNMVRTFDEESLICSLFDKKRQNLFLTWENTMAFETMWNNVIYQLSLELFKFHVNTIHDTASTQSNLKLWNKAASGNCTLCSKQGTRCSKQGTLNHILTARLHLDLGMFQLAT